MQMLAGRLLPSVPLLLHGVQELFRPLMLQQLLKAACRLFYVLC